MNNTTFTDSYGNVATYEQLAKSIVDDVKSDPNFFGRDISSYTAEELAEQYAEGAADENDLVCGVPIDEFVTALAAAIDDYR